MNSNKSVDAFLNRVVTEHQLPGLSVVVQRDGQEVFAAGYGHRDVKHQCPVTADTLFGVASVTKIVTALTVMQLAEQQQLSITDAVAEHYPELTIAKTSPMQLMHLLGHSAGFPGLPSRFFAYNIADESDRSGGIARGPQALQPFSSNDRPHVTDKNELADLLNTLDIKLLAPPGALLSYCNEGFCLLGGVIETLLNCTYADAVNQRVFKPLGMTRSTIGGQQLEAFTNVAASLVRDADQTYATPVWDAPLFYAAGGMVSSARDLVRLLDVFDASSTFINQKSRHQMTTPHSAVASRPCRPGINTQHGYGFGLEIETVDADTQLIWHTGQRAGISSFVGRMMDQNINIAVLCNVADAPTACIGHALFSQILDRTDITWPPTRPSSEKIEPLEYHIEHLSLTGIYTSDEGFEISIEQQNDTLMLHHNGTRQRMVFSDHDSGTAGEQTFRFLTQDGASPWALALDLRVLRRHKF